MFFGKKQAKPFTERMPQCIPIVSPLYIHYVPFTAPPKDAEPSKTHYKIVISVLFLSFFLGAQGIYVYIIMWYPTAIINPPARSFCLRGTVTLGFCPLGFLHRCSPPPKKKQHWLVVRNIWFIFPYIGNVIMSSSQLLLTHICQRGSFTTNQNNDGKSEKIITLPGKSTRNGPFP